MLELRVKLVGTGATESQRRQEGSRIKLSQSSIIIRICKAQAARANHDPSQAFCFRCSSSPSLVTRPLGLCFGAVCKLHKLLGHLFAPANSSAFHILAITLASQYLLSCKVSLQLGNILLRYFIIVKRSRWQEFAYRVPATRSRLISKTWSIAKLPTVLSITRQP